MLAIITLVLEIIILGIVKSIGIVDVGNTMATLLIFLFSVIFIATIQKSELIGEFNQQIIVGYLFRVAILFFDLFGTKIFVLPQSGADSLMFYRAAEQWTVNGIESTRGFFVYAMFKLFEFIGVNRLYAQFLLMLFSIASLIIFVLIIDKLVIDDAIKAYSAWIFCLLPNFALLSSLFLRESLVTFLISVSVYFFIKWMKSGSNTFFLFAVVFSVLCCLFHSGCIGITIGYVICSLLYDPYGQKIHASFNGTLLAFAFALGAAFLFLNYGDSLLGKFTRLETIKDIANTSDGADSSYVKYVGNSNNPVNMLIFTVPRMVYFLFSPFPWQWRGITDIIAFFFSSMFYLITIKKAIKYLNSKEQMNREIIICLLIVAFFCTFIFAWGVSNTGTASRHRDKMVCLYGIVYALTSNLGLISQKTKSIKTIKGKQKSYIYQ